MVMKPKRANVVVKKVVSLYIFFDLIHCSIRKCLLNVPKYSEFIFKAEIINRS